MVGTANNSIAYAGIVTLSQQVNTKKFTLAKMHNAGGISLFNFMADCIAGDFSNANVNRPKMIVLLNKDDSGNYTLAENAEWVALLSNPERVYSLTEGIVRYSFIIPYEQLAGSNFNAIGLYSNKTTDLQNFSAVCHIDAEDISNLSKSSSLAVDWELHICNP
jgi:hypothetical protein